MSTHDADLMHIRLMQIQMRIGTVLITPALHRIDDFLPLIAMSYVRCTVHHTFGGSLTWKIVQQEYANR